MTTTIEALRGREQKAMNEALEQIAVAARTVAAGGTTDVDTVSTALATLGKTSEDFEKAVALARRRAEWLIAADKVTSAKSKVTKTETALQAEAEKFIAARDAYAHKAFVLQHELDEANQTIRDGNTARERLLDPVNVPGGIAAEYAQAFADARKGENDRNNAEQGLRQIEARLMSVANWVERISGQKPEDIDPTTWKAPEGVPEWQADGHGGELDKKLKEWRAVVRDRDAARETLATTTKNYAAAKKRRDGMIQEVLKS